MWIYVRSVLHFPKHGDIGIFITIYCHSPEGDTAAALAHNTFIRYMLTQNRATMQRPWRRLRSLDALVLTVLLLLNSKPEVFHKFIMN